MVCLFKKKIAYFKKKKIVKIYGTQKNITNVLYWYECILLLSFETESQFSKNIL